MALASVDDYENNKIKKHEFTLAKKEEDRTKLTNIQNANIGPVFLTFRENQEAIKAIIDAASSRPCYADVTCDDGVRHVLWRCSLDEAASLEVEFAKIPNTYIADGHHRAASAFNVGKMRR